MVLRGSKNYKAKRNVKKLKALHHICLAIAQTKINHFSFSLYKIVAVAAPDTSDAPTSKIYITAEANFFQIR